MARPKKNAEENLREMSLLGRKHQGDSVLCPRLFHPHAPVTAHGSLEEARIPGSKQEVSL